MMGKKITLVLPLPPKELSPNASSPWAPTAKWFRIRARKEYRKRILDECFAQIPMEVRVSWDGWYFHRCQMTETYRFADKRKRDVRNLFAAFKAGEDGLVDACVLPGDDDSVLEHGPPRIERVKTKAEEGVVVEIEEIA